MVECFRFVCFFVRVECIDPLRIPECVEDAP
jgi:hypothetical protein